MTSASPTRVYLDYNASTPVHPDVVDAVMTALRTGGNPSSSHGTGRAARAWVEQAREAVARLAGCQPTDVVLTSGATEALSLAIHAILGDVRQRSPRPHVVASALEHDAVLAPLQTAAKRSEIDLDLVRPDSVGVVAAHSVREVLREDTALVALLAAQNELGSIQPLDQVAEACRKVGAVMLCDAVQATGRGLDLATLDADLLTISGHKFGGPPGIGALIRRNPNIRLIARTEGGLQEWGLRAGTENAPAAAGLARAIVLLEAGALGNHFEMREMRGQICQDLVALVPGATILGPSNSDLVLPQTIAVRLPGYDAETLVAALDLEGIAVSAGSACASGALTPSHVLEAIGLGEREAREVIRISFGYDTQPAELTRALDALRHVLPQVYLED